MGDGVEKVIIKHREAKPGLKRILIISPHFPPSNLAAVHRSRLFAQHLPAFNWEPIVLSVHEDYYEEELDLNLQKLLPSNLRIEKVNAFKVGKRRLVGDIGLRGFFQLYKRAKKIITTEKIDFLYIPIPPFYVALLGRWLHKTTGVKYGIDYIDPWVHHFPGSDKIFSRHWFSTKLAKFLEPIAIKNTSVITGVAEGYYKGVQQRNPLLSKTCLFDAMPYGGEKSDHEAMKKLNLKPYLFEKKIGKIQLVYAGAMLPKAYGPLEEIMKSIQRNRNVFENVEFHFIGTGKTPNDPLGYNIKPLAEKYNLWQSIVYEYPKRIPYLDVLIHLEAADGIFILGSTEPHYTPSKVYQGVLSQKPVLAVLHSSSTASSVLKEANIGVSILFDGEDDISTIGKTFSHSFLEFMAYRTTYKFENTNITAFDNYSAKAVTARLVNLLNKIVR